MDSKQEYRRLFASIPTTMFAQFVSLARSNGYIRKDDNTKTDIEAALKDLVIAYAERRVIILTPDEFNKALRNMATEHVNAISE